MAFNRNNRSGGGHDFGRYASRQGGRRFDADRGGDRQMFKATCSNCGKECEIPFKPTGSKPVYCSDCFRTMRGPDSRRPEDRGSRKPNFDNRSDNRGSGQPQYREQFEALNAKLDKILKMLTPANSTEVAQVVEKPQEEIILAEETTPIIEKRKRVSKKITPATKEQA